MVINERVSIFINGGNFYHSSKRLNLLGKINFEELIKELLRKRTLKEINYYVAPLDSEIDKQKYWDHEKFLATLRKIQNFNVILCKLKKIKIKGNYKFFIKGDDTRLVHDLIVGAYENLYDTAIIVSGDEDFAYTVNTLKKLRKKVENAYFSSSSSYALKRVCDYSIHLNKLLKSPVLS